MTTLHVHDWRGVDDGRVCASCCEHEREGTRQESNGAMLLNLWEIGEKTFDAMLAGVSKQVEKVEKRQIPAAAVDIECLHCTNPAVWRWTDLGGNESVAICQRCAATVGPYQYAPLWQFQLILPVPADGAICKNCSYAYEEHGGLEGFCPNIWSEDSDWSSTRRFTR